ncbi:MAG: alanine racemase [Culicoidibacterales bacterium]
MNEQILQQSANFSTPMYIFDIEKLIKWVAKIETALGEHTICYAMKANPLLVTPLENAVETFEVCSPGEYEICCNRNIAAKQIVVSGVFKDAADIEAIIRKEEQPLYTIESSSQLELLVELAKKYNKKIKVIIRLSSGNQFGVDKETLIEIIKKSDDYQNLSWQGIQYYSGTQKGKMAKVIEEIVMLDDFISELWETYGFRVKLLEYGPGLKASYFSGEVVEDDINQVYALKKQLDQMKFSGKITLEIGRFIAASCGYYVTTISDTKRTEGINYAIADGGIHHLNYYGQFLGMKKPKLFLDHDKKGELEKWHICGALCTVSDVLVKEITISPLEIGDRLVFTQVGAYSITEGIYLFLTRDLPMVLFYTKNKGLHVVRESRATHTINTISTT